MNSQPTWKVILKMPFSKILWHQEKLYSVQIAVVSSLHMFSSFSDDLMISEKYSSAIEVKK